MALDWAILHFIRDNIQCKFLDFLMPKLTLLGDKGIVWIAVTLVLLCTKKYRKQGIFAAVSLILCVIVGNLLLKNLVARDRPCWIESVNLLIKNPKDFSFPSGHSMSCASAATILCLTNRKFSWGAITLALIICFSRLYLYVHFPTDVIAGCIIGVAIALLVWNVGNRITDSIIEKNKQNKG